MYHLMIEHASIRQNVKRGFILFMASPNYTPESRYGQVVSWHIYATKRQAQDVIDLITMIAASNLIIGA